MIEDVEESVLRLVLEEQFLNVVDEQDVNLLVEVEEVIDRVFADGIGILVQEEVSGNVEDAFLGEEEEYLIPDGMTEVRLAYTRRAVEVERVEGALPRVMHDIFGSRAGEAITFPFEEVVKRILGDELGREMGDGGLRKGSICLCGLWAWRKGCRRIGSADEVGQGGVLADDAVDGVTEDVYMVVFQILVEVLRGYLKGKAFSFAGGGNNGGKPSVEGRFSHFSSDVGETFVPYDFVIGLHSSILTSYFSEHKGGGKKEQKKGRCRLAVSSTFVTKRLGGKPSFSAVPHGGMRASKPFGGGASSAVKFSRTPSKPLSMND
jgi:hypothetical protein